MYNHFSDVRMPSGLWWLSLKVKNTCLVSMTADSPGKLLYMYYCMYIHVCTYIHDIMYDVHVHVHKEPH